MPEVTRQRINLWSSPRNISTALLYAFAQRPDTAAVDEPLYAHYLLHQPTQAAHPGREEVLASQEHDGRRIIDRMLEHDYGRPVVVFKQMTHHLVELPLDFLDRMQHVLLIRHPEEILASFSKVVTRVTALDVGLPQQEQLFGHLQQSGSLTAVVDSRRLLQDPPGVLRRLCERLDLPYTDAMLQWPAGPKAFDGSWAPYWYGGVHRSTGFRPYEERHVSLSPSLARIAAESLPIYRRLLEHAL